MKISSELKVFVSDHENDNVCDLALQNSKDKTIDIQMAIRQISGRKIAKIKIPRWYANEDIIYPMGLSMEQCSSWQTAAYKSNLVNGKLMIDLTGGFGVDCAYFARNFTNVLYVEQQKELADIALHNYKILEANNISVYNCDAVRFLSDCAPVDFIYIDPARRSDIGRKTMLIEDCVPNIIEIQTQLNEKATTIILKLSPMLDISTALKSLNNVSDIHIVSVNNECKELLILKQKNYIGRALLHCVNLQNEKIEKFSFYKEDENDLQIQYTSQIGKYLYEPNASLLKAGAFKSIANNSWVQKLHASSHLYTSDDYNADFQGRKFDVIDICSLNKKELKEHLNGITKANVSTRNFPIKPEELKKESA